MREAAASVAGALPHDRAVDLVREFIEPWCATAADIVAGANPLPDARVPHDAPTHIALARTLAGLLANGWLALVSHPQEFARLRGEPQLVARAIEEMLRYACVPQAMFRSVTEDLELRGARLAAGDRIVLALASANRDPEQFAEPNRFDILRRAPAHLAFGFGPHSCVGAALIRMSAAIATEICALRFTEPRLDGPVVWGETSGSQTAASFHIVENMVDNGSPE